jgi:hypothetical protein
LAIYFKLTSSLESRALYETTIFAFFLAFANEAPCDVVKDVPEEPR